MRSHEIEERIKRWNRVLLRASIPGVLAAVVALLFGERSQIVLGVCYFILAVSMCAFFVAFIASGYLALKLFVSRT